MRVTKGNQMTAQAPAQITLDEIIFYATTQYNKGEGYYECSYNGLGRFDSLSDVVHGTIRFTITHKYYDFHVERYCTWSLSDEGEPQILFAGPCKYSITLSGAVIVRERDDSFPMPIDELAVTRLLDLDSKLWNARMFTELTRNKCDAETAHSLLHDEYVNRTYPINLYPHV